MTEIKFRYVLEGESGVYFEYRTIEQIESKLLVANNIKARNLHTGLKDKNGKEIYEGDVIEFEYGRGKVEFDEGMFQYRPATGNSWKIEEGVTCSAYYPVTEAKVEIIGNIYENPDLLKDNLA